MGIIKLTGFGEQVKLGLSPRTKAVIGKKMNYKDFKKLILELGSSHEAILSYKEVIK